LKEVLVAIKSATKGTSPLPALLADAKTNKDMQNVLKLASEDDELARGLAELLLASKTGKEVAAAFAAIALESATSGTDDPEVLLKAKLDSLISVTVGEGELIISEIKGAFFKAAQAANTADELNGAL
jgi:hypothetical protein